MDDLSLNTNQVDLTLNMDDGDSDLVEFDPLFNLLLNFIVLSFLGNEWNWSHVEKLITLLIKFCLREVLDVNISVSKVLVISVVHCF